MIYVLQHGFGKERFTSYNRYVRLIKGRGLIAQRRRREQLILERSAEGIKDAAGSHFRKDSLFSCESPMLHCCGDSFCSFEV